MKIVTLVQELLKEQALLDLREEAYQDLFNFLDNKVQKMSMGTAYYVASMDTSMNKKLPDGTPNPMYGKLFKNTRFMFRWEDTFKRSVQRSG
jgi:hypothetical protein